MDLTERDDEEDKVAATSPHRQPTAVPITPEEPMKEQATDEVCMEIMVGRNQRRGALFEANKYGLLVRKVQYQAQIVLPEVLRERVLYMAHYSVTSAHPGGRRIYTSIRRNLYWPGLVLDCYATVKQWPTRAQNRVVVRKHWNKLHLFRANGSLELVAIDILGPFLKTEKRNLFLLIMTDRDSKLT